MCRTELLPIAQLLGPFLERKGEGRGYFPSRHLLTRSDIDLFANFKNIPIIAKALGSLKPVHPSESAIHFPNSRAITYQLSKRSWSLAETD